MTCVCRLIMMEYFVLMILVLMPGVWSGDWSVTSGNKCALERTSVVIKCGYKYPSGHSVTSVSWLKVHNVAGQWKQVPLSELPSPPDHFEYVGNKNGDCDLKINDVHPTDAGYYYFSFVTTHNRWRSKYPAYLFVKGLTAVVRPTTLSEGDDVHLFCRSGCLTSVDTVWFRDGQRVLKPVFQARREDAGSYQCAVFGQETAKSASVTLNVLYAPKNVTLSISSQGDIVRGSSVTFTCSCKANPPVTYEGYSLYKDGQLVTLGLHLNISDIQPSHSGLYHCQAWNNISWRDTYIINSTDIHLDVQYEPVNVSLSVEPKEVTEGSSVNMTCSSVANPAADSYTWYRKTESSNSSSSSRSSSMVQVGSGQMLSLNSVEVSHYGLYFCLARNSVGENNSTEFLLIVNRRKQGSQFRQIIAGLAGVVGGVALVTVLLLFMKRQRTYTEKGAGFDSRLRTSSSSSSVKEDPLPSIYANIHTVPPSAPLTSSTEVDVIYSTVTIKPKETNVTCHISNRRAQQEPQSRAAEEEEDTVIYTTVAKSRGS